MDVGVSGKLTVRVEGEETVEDRTSILPEVEETVEILPSD